MSRIINFEREFFKAAKDLEKKAEVKQEFMIRVSDISEKWIDNKLSLNQLFLELIVHENSS